MEYKFVPDLRIIMAKKTNTTPRVSSEEKIKQAARAVFTKKGYAATKTRDIASEAGINLALLNYYFRSKEKLFELIMLESAERFFLSLRSILYNHETSFEEKLNLLVSQYIDMLTQEPNFPFFILSEIQANPEKLLKQLGAKEALQQSVFFKQMAVILEKKKIKLHPMHLLVNAISMTVFPFIAKPIVKSVSGTDENQFNQMMQERKKQIPLWILQTLNQS
jgi:AcrR family transcriptional regulator